MKEEGRVRRRQDGGRREAGQTHHAQPHSPQLDAGLGHAPLLIPHAGVHDSRPDHESEVHCRCVRCYPAVRCCVSWLKLCVVAEAVCCKEGLAEGRRRPSEDEELELRRVKSRSWMGTKSLASAQRWQSHSSLVTTTERARGEAITITSTECERSQSGASDGQAS